ncbi:MAG: response regulator [Thermoguttaceae bacterium]|nr:response regulator [Thermoguttaceae bacterium]
MESNYYPRRKRVVIVDDDPEVLESVRLALESFGYDVETASDGATGLALVERSRPDLMILDMMIPKRSGYLVLETLRQIDDFPTRIIMITANEGNRHKEYAEALGVDAYIRKPFAMDELMREIDRIFDES